MTRTLLAILQGKSGMTGVEEYRYLTAIADAARAALHPGPLGRAIPGSPNLAAVAASLGTSTAQAVAAVLGLDPEDRAVVDLAIDPLILEYAGKLR